MRLKGSTLFSLFLVLLFAMAIITAAGYNARARMAPLVISIPGLLLAVGWLVFELRTEGKAGKGEKRWDASGEVGVSPAGKRRMWLSLARSAKNNPPAGSGPGSAGTWRELDPFFWLAVLLAMLYLFGFIVTIPLFTFLYLKVRSREGWPLSIILSLASWGILYALFAQVLHIALYPGLLYQYLR